MSGSHAPTRSEQYVAELCDRSFLKLWCYPSPFRNQGKKSEKGDGKDEETTRAIFQRKSDGKHFMLEMHDAGMYGPETLTLATELVEVTKTKEVKTTTKWS